MEDRLGTRLDCYHAGDYAIAELVRNDWWGSTSDCLVTSYIADRDVEIAYRAIRKARELGAWVDVHA